jgi:hypothetical protein
MNCEGSINRKTISGKQMTGLKKYLEFSIIFKSLILIDELEIELNSSTRTSRGFKMVIYLRNHSKDSRMLEKQSMAVRDDSKSLIGYRQNTFHIC